MSKDFLEAFGSEPQPSDKGGTPHWSGDMLGRIGTHNNATESLDSSSLICPDTGKLTTHNSQDLQAQLRQFRIDSEFSSSRVTSEPQPPLASKKRSLVEVDDELHGRDGEWLVVVDITPDRQVVMLQCCETGKVFTRAARAVQDDVRGNRLKVHRYWPDAPPEYED